MCTMPELHIASLSQRRIAVQPPLKSFDLIKNNCAQTICKYEGHEDNASLQTHSYTGMQIRADTQIHQGTCTRTRSSSTRAYTTSDLLHAVHCWWLCNLKGLWIQNPAWPSIDLCHCVHFQPLQRSPCVSPLLCIPLHVSLVH